MKAKHAKAKHFKPMSFKNRILLTIMCVSLSICVAIGGSYTYAYLITAKSSDEAAFTNSTIVAPSVSHDSAVSNAAMVPGSKISVSSYVKANSGTNVATYLFVKVTKTGNLDAYLDYTYDSGWTVYSSAATSSSATSASDILYRKVAASTTDNYYIYASKQVTVESNNTISDSGANPGITVTAALAQQDGRDATQAYNLISSVL